MPVGPLSAAIFSGSAGFCAHPTASSRTTVNKIAMIFFMILLLFPADDPPALF